MIQSRKCLLIRLSSLGDVILATSALQVDALPSQVDWLGSSDYSEIFKNHPRINKLYSFDRKGGFFGWLKLCRAFWDQSYDEVYDLHGSLRTLGMRVLFLFWGVRDVGLRRIKKAQPRWHVISKQKFRLWGYFIFKRFWPKLVRPEPWVRRFAQLVGGSGNERPNLSHLSLDSEVHKGQLPFDRKLNWVCVMPSSRWSGKKWPVASYADLVVKMRVFPVVLGGPKDLESFELCRELEMRSVPYFSAVGQWGLAKTAWVLSLCPGGYLGGDTGLAHLAEAVGARAQMIFGPTDPEMGFGPWRAQSLAIQKSLACRPCSRDGRFCYRLSQPYHCMRGLSAQDAYIQISGGGN